jgi:hypothetical protein
MGRGGGGDRVALFKGRAARPSADAARNDAANLLHACTDPTFFLQAFSCDVKRSADMGSWGAGLTGFVIAIREAFQTRRLRNGRRLAAWRGLVPRQHRPVGNHNSRLYFMPAAKKGRTVARDGGRGSHHKAALLIASARPKAATMALAVSGTDRDTRRSSGTELSSS